MKTTKDLIQFWIDNDFIFKDREWEYWKEYDFYMEENSIVITKDWEIFNELNLIETISWGPFIESIARGIWKDLKVYTDEQTHVIYRRDKKDRTFIEIETLEDMITHQLAFAIRENSVDWVSLDKFITNILKDD